MESQTIGNAKMIWQEFENELNGARFVLAAAQPSRFHFPAKFDFQTQPDAAFLRSPFAYDYLHFLPELSDTTRAKCIVAFDSNVATRLNNNHDGLRQVVSKIGQDRFRWNYSSYLMEKLTDLPEGRDRNHVFNTVLTFERLATCDFKNLQQSGAIVSFLEDSELERRATLEIETQHQEFRNGRGVQIRHRLNLFYIFALKAAIIHLKKPSKEAAASKLLELLEFLGDKLRCLPPLAVVAAVKFFVEGPNFAPFAKLANKKPLLKNEARNVAWDFLHLQIGHEFTGFNGPGGTFLLRYFLTFDKGLKDLFDVCRYRSCLIFPGQSFPTFHPDFDIPSEIIARFPGKNYHELSAAVFKYFTGRAQEERTAQLQINPTDVPKLIEDLESEVSRLKRQ